MNIELVRLTPQYKEQLLDMLTERTADWSRDTGFNCRALNEPANAYFVQVRFSLWRSS